MIFVTRPFSCVDSFCRLLIRFHVSVIILSCCYRLERPKPLVCRSLAREFEGIYIVIRSSSSSLYIIYYKLIYCISKFELSCNR